MVYGVKPVSGEAMALFQDYLSIITAALHLLM